MTLLEEAARQLYREWFVRLHFPGHEHVPIIDGVPKGWIKSSCYGVMNVLSGGTPKTTDSDCWDGDIRSTRQKMHPIPITLLPLSGLLQSLD